MTDQSEKKQYDVSRLETGLQQGKNIWEKIKKRKIQPEIRDLINRSRIKIHRRSIQLQEFSYKRFFQRRRNGISLSFNLAKRNVIRSRYRSLLLILGIILTIALETGIVISVDTLYDDFLLDNRNQNFTDITVHPTTWHDIEDLRTVASTTKKVSGVAKSSPVYYAGVDQFLGEQISSSNILVYGIEPSTHPDFSHINLTAGRRIIDSNTIIISERLYDQLDVQIDQNINLGDLGDDFESLDVTIGGVMHNEPFFGNKIGYTFILVDIDTLYDIIPDNRKNETLSSEIDIEVTNLMNIQQTSEKIKDVVGVSYFVFTEKDISGIEASGIRAYQTAMNLVILASFVVEFLFITNILAISIRDRSKEFGILRAVGTGSYQLIESVAAEILIYSIIGCTIGLVVGIGFSNELIEIMDNFYASIQFQGVSLHFSSLTATFLSGIIVALISGLYPIFIAISVPVVQNLHSKMGGGNSKSTISQSWKYTIITGFLLALVGFSLQFFVGPSRFLDFEILSFHFLTVLLIFIGTLFLEIGILVFLPKIAMRMLIGFNIVTRTISTRNIAREFQKSLFTILTSGLALTFIIVVGLVSAAVIAGAPDYFQGQWGNIDLVAETSDLNPLSLTYTNILERDYRITGSSFIQEARTEISGRDGYVYGVDPTKYADFAETVVDSIDSGIPSDSYLNPLNPNTTNGLISHLLYQKLSIPLGSNVSIKIADNSTVNVTLTCVIKGNLFLGGGEYLYISTNRFQELYQTTRARWFICDVEGSVRSVENSLENRGLFRDVISITFFAEMMERSILFQSAIFQLLFVESFILAAIAQFICILVSTLRMEREIGIMRSLGLTRRGVFGIFLTESVALGISALFVGLIDGLLGSVLLAEYISNSIPITINFPAISPPFSSGMERRSNRDTSHRRFREWVRRGRADHSPKRRFPPCRLRSCR